MRGTLVYFDVFDTIGDPKRDWDSSLVKLPRANLRTWMEFELIPRTKGSTHVVVDAKRPDRYRALSLALKKG